MGYGIPSIVNREYVVRSLSLLYDATVLKRDISKVVKHEEKEFPYIKEALALIRAKKEKGRQ